MSTQYVGSVQHAAVAQWAALTSYSVGNLRRQLAAPTVGNERVFRCTTAGTSGVSEPSWNLTTGATTADGTAVWTEVTGSATYNVTPLWGAPHARLNCALQSSWSTNDDLIWVADDHDETQSTFWQVIPSGSRKVIVCVDPSAAPPTAKSTGAAFKSTFASSNPLEIRLADAFTYGLTFDTSGVSSASAGRININTGGNRIPTGPMEECTFKLNTSSSGYLGINGTGILTLKNPTIHFGHASQTINCSGMVTRILSDGRSLFGGATYPTTLFTGSGSGAFQEVEMSGVDLSALGSGKSLVNPTGNSTSLKMHLDACKLGASFAILAAAIPNANSSEIDITRCDSADTHTREEHYRYEGSVVQETTIVRSGGAELSGVPYSLKAVTLSTAKFIRPLYTPWDYRWNDAVGSPVTVDIEVVTDGVTLSDKDIWLEAQALTTNSFPLSALSTGRNSDLVGILQGGSGTNHTSSSETWTTTGLSSPTKQKLSITFTPETVGPWAIRVAVARASTTVYICPEYSV